MKKMLITGCNLIDKDFGGLKQGEITLIGGRPLMGKTMLALQLALNVAKSGKKVLFISAQNTSVELKTRMISLILSIPSQRLNELDLTDDEWELYKKTARAVNELPIHFCHADTICLMREWCEDKGRLSADMIIYDFLQMIHYNYTETRDGTSENTPVKYLKMLKKLDREYKAPMLVLTQLSRRLEKRKDKRPRITDIRVANLSSDVYDQAILIYRESYYSIDAPKDKAELIGICEKQNFKKTYEVLWNYERGFFE